MGDKILMTIQVDNGIKIAKRLSTTETLNNLRKLLGDKIPKNAIFILNDGSEIDIEDEIDSKIEEIRDNKKIYMKLKKDENEIPIEIYVNEELKYIKDLSKMLTLKEIRQILSDIMIKETYFLADEDVQIDLNKEEEIILEDILDGNKLKIKYASIESAPKPVGIEKDLDKLSNSSENNIIKEEKNCLNFI